MMVVGPPLFFLVSVVALIDAAVRLPDGVSSHSISVASGVWKGKYTVQ